MSRHKNALTIKEKRKAGLALSQVAIDDGSNTKRSPEQLARLADMIATGEVALPLDLGVAEQESLLAHVAAHRRSRLVTFLAQAIAHDIARSRGI